MSPTPSPFGNASPTTRGVLTPDDQRLGGHKVFEDGASIEQGGVDRQLRPEANPRDFGAVGDGVIDDYAAFRAAIDSFSPNGGSRGGILRITPGTYRLSQTLRIDKQISIIGEAGGFNDPSCILRPDPGVDGLLIERAYSSVHGSAGDFSLMDNVMVYPISKAGTAHGVVVKAPFAMRNCSVYRCSGDGVHMYASLPDVADLSLYENCFFSDNTGNGFACKGSDANACLISRCSSTQNGGWGFYDESFLGNTYIACHTALNAGGPYTNVQATSQSLYLGCYSEGDQPPSVINHPAMLLGGLHGADVNPGLKDGGWVFCDDAHMRWFSVHSYGHAPGLMRVGGLDVLGEFLSWTVDETGDRLQLRYGNTRTDGGFRGTYAFNWNNVAANSLYLAGSLGVAPNERVLGVSSIAFPNGFWIGDFVPGGQPALSVLRVVSSSAIPTTGSWEQGDEVKNTAPVAGGNMGWVCVGSGTFGAYSEGRTVTADGANFHVILSAPSAALAPGQIVTIGGVTARINLLPPWRPDTSYQLQQKVINDGGKVYQCITAGTTDTFGTSGPTGTGANITDLQAHWKYIGTSDTILSTSQIIPAGAGQAIAYVAPTFKTYGTISA